jgi:glycosyltransferase involved in cell wall biosynthesis
MSDWLKNNIKNFDIIHMHNFRSYQNNLAYKYCKQHNIPYILQAHGSAPRIIEKQGLKRLYDLLWGYKILNGAYKLIAVSDVEVDQYIQMGVSAQRIAVIPNGIELPSIGDITKRNTIKSSFGIGESSKVILYIGRLHKRKGIDFLIKSFSDLAQINNNLFLVIVGPDDGFKEELELLVNDLNLFNKVKFYGFIEDIKQAYQDADIVVYPAALEIFGLVPFEAILCGKPVIVTNDCGCGKLVKNADCGYLVEYGNIIDLREKMNYALYHPIEGNEKVKRGQKYICENLVWGQIVKKVEEIYKNCV